MKKFVITHHNMEVCIKNSDFVINPSPPQPLSLCTVGNVITVEPKQLRGEKVLNQTKIFLLLILIVAN